MLTLYSVHYKGCCQNTYCNFHYTVCTQCIACRAQFGTKKFFYWIVHTRHTQCRSKLCNLSAKMYARCMIRVLRAKKVCQFSVERMLVIVFSIFTVTLVIRWRRPQAGFSEPIVDNLQGTTLKDSTLDSSLDSTCTLLCKFMLFEIEMALIVPVSTCATAQLDANRSTAQV